MLRKNEITKKSKARKRAEMKAKFQANPEECKQYAEYLEKQRLIMREHRAKAKGMLFM